MFSSTAAEPMRAFPLHERQPSDQSRSYANPPRHLVELPRPLEPRPTHQLHSAHSEASRDRRRSDGFGQPAPMQPEYRPQTQNLPRLHDILTSGPSAPSPPTYGGSWNNTAGPPALQQNGDGHYSHNGWHPPMVEPPRGHESSYHSQQGRRLELPILETSPVTRHDSHVPQQSPYHTYHEPRREYDPRRERPHEPPSASYLPNRAEEQHYRSPAGSIDRPRTHAFPPNAPESSKKYIGVREVPGEGQFHLYEGGYRIPTSVDGENVNPAWGLTKANKPRKRLAMACLDCREKKIKCEPGASSCLQCEKAKRPCRKAPTHQSQSEPGTTPVWQSSAGSPVRNTGFPDPNHANIRELEFDPSTKRRTLDDDSPSGGPAKKHRSTSPVQAVNGNGLPGHGSASLHTSPVMPRSPGKVVCLEEDPYAAEPEMTLTLLEYYLTDVNDATYRMFPRHHLMHWLRAYPQKSQNERMVLYAILALGSTFADDQYSGFGKHCANIATEAVLSKSGRSTMAFIQTRLILGLYHFARGANSAAWEYISAGVSAGSYLCYHTEDGCAEDETAGERRSEFALSKEQLIECKRRTLWSGFIMDRYCGATHTMINNQDIFIRLPCTDDAFERGFASNAPFHNNGIVDPSRAILTASSALSPMAWVILISAIWGDVVNFINRSVHRAPNSYEDQYEKFYDDTHAALQGWQSRLPDHLQFSRPNAERSIQGGYAGPFVSMHILYHLSFLKMNRFVRHEYISKSIARNVRGTHRHALEILQVMSCLRAANDGLAKENHQTFSLTMSFAGYAILAAIDVVGAGGLDSGLTTTLDLIGCGLESLRELGRYWNSARDQHKACEKRFYQIHNVLKHPFTARSGCWLGREWGVHSSLEREFDLKDDCIYGVSDRDYFDALKEDTPEGRPNGTLRIA
ncbi:hypothetical protein CLAFUW4_06918 [Fulvia fulva]|nr:hypothetical protein CLAFUR4_06927 [Fulvia fulva]WPV16417.1 hypothetical protein CLAFUW4_06918 [Fulvia fulva]WPV31304.1 hypothetical protein CLAFUW7_06918 [Fulvia fulva]